jgi:hypothetical protein
MHGVEHRPPQCFQPKPHLHVLNAVEDESSTKYEELTSAQHLFANLCGRGKSKDLLRVHATSPKGELVDVARINRDRLGL